jgi:hypothetical protein
MLQPYKLREISPQAGDESGDARAVIFVDAPAEAYRENVGRCARL